MLISETLRPVDMPVPAEAAPHGGHEPGTPDANGDCHADIPAPLDATAFAAVVASAPLVSIDLIVEDAHGAVLLGLRNNPPAKGYWFVPGGRIRKGEKLDDAFSRTASDELGRNIHRTQSRFVGVHEHFYDTNFIGTVGAITHYIVLAYRLRVERGSLQLPTDQHSEFTWMQPDLLMQRPDVHPYTQAYFLSELTRR